MSDDFRGQIHNEINLRDTDDLLDIWRENNRVEWSDVAFEIIREILKQRGVEIPEQAEPVYEYKEVEEDDDEEVEDYDFSDEELKIIDDENQPEFYDPFEVLRYSQWIDLMAKVLIGLIVVRSLLNFSSSEGMIRSLFIRHPDSALILPIAVLVVAANAAMGSLLAYIPLKALSRILKILMEMEFNSRRTS